MLKKVYDTFEEGVSVALFLLIFLLMTTQIITRYIFNFSFSWNIELSRYTFVWLTFVGAAFVRREDSHIKIEILFNCVNKLLPPAGQKVFWLFKQMLSFAYLLALIWLGYVLASKSIRFKSQAMQISQFYLYISVTVGACMYLYREIQGCVRSYCEYFGKGGK
ncbi:hypothetical protein U27_06905 [Candidatus Vecturithrix granuli]|uniref:Tripartite ATP-independent periplasmic transporters DctQ component domain-containing protein n=1 Tax=Vecturithrix granuli TaxID=1499967 RepID=A0A081C5R4_VECG1|nr:hypothetical protein U27_06905 [Candidatus Vecturithrix granuli]